MVTESDHTLPLDSRDSAGPGGEVGCFIFTNPHLVCAALLAIAVFLCAVPSAPAQGGIGSAQFLITVDGADFGNTTTGVQPATSGSAASLLWNPGGLLRFSTDRTRSTTRPAGQRTAWVGRRWVRRSTCPTAYQCNTMIPRNTYIGDPLYSVDFHLGRDFQLRERTRLELGVDAFNLLNRPNVDEVTSVYGSPVFCGTTPAIPRHYKDTTSPAIQGGAASTACPAGPIGFPGGSLAPTPIGTNLFIPSKPNADLDCHGRCSTRGSFSSWRRSHFEWCSTGIPAHAETGAEMRAKRGRYWLTKTPAGRM
jgi:hypothetical protein